MPPLEGRAPAATRRAALGAGSIGKGWWSCLKKKRCACDRMAHTHTHKGATATDGAGVLILLPLPLPRLPLLRLGLGALNAGVPATFHGVRGLCCLL